MVMVCPATLDARGAFQKVSEGGGRKIHRDGNPASTSVCHRCRAVDRPAAGAVSAGADVGRCSHRFLSRSCVALFCQVWACGPRWLYRSPRARLISAWWRCHCHYDHGNMARTPLWDFTADSGDETNV
jgi:hypothetical protein